MENGQRCRDHISPRHQVRSVQYCAMSSRRRASTGKPQRQPRAPEPRWPSFVIPGLAALLTLAVVAGLISTLISSDDGDQNLERAGAIGECENAHIAPGTGIASGLACDNRRGAPLPDLRQGDPQLASRTAGCRLEIDLRSEGTAHVPPNIPVPYRTDPATSGPMYDDTIADGAYLTTPPAPHVVHSLEHGRIAIQYDPSLPDSAQLLLKSISDQAPEQVLLFPNREMGPTVAAAAWRKLLACPDYNARVLDAVRTFRDVYRDQGAETATGLPR